MPASFKAGDRVVRVAGEHNGMKMGDEGTVVDNEGGFAVKLEEFTGGHDPNNLLLKTPLPIPIGSKVKMNDASCRKGCVGVVTGYTERGLVISDLVGIGEWKTDAHRYDVFNPEDIIAIDGAIPNETMRDIIEDMPVILTPVREEVMHMPRTLNDFKIGDRVVRVEKDNTSRFPIGTKAIVMGYAPPSLKVAPLVVDLEGVASTELRAWYPEHTEYSNWDVKLELVTRVIEG